MKEPREYPASIKKGDIIETDLGRYVVVKTPAEIKSHSCEVKDSKGKRFWQFAYKGMVINGKAID